MYVPQPIDKEKASSNKKHTSFEKIYFWFVSPDCSLFGIYASWL